jgi:hypothetical protein
MRLTISLQPNAQHVDALNGTLPEAQEYFRKREPISTAESIGASGSMFRVFRGIDKPSAHYKTWAFDQVRSPQFERDVLSLTSQENFERFHSSLGDSLSNYWRDKTGNELIRPYKFKLLDVFIKRACELQLPNPKMNEILLSFGHVPLDKLVFDSLDKLFSGSLLLSGRTMGDVETDDAYRFYQTLIRDIMAQLGSPALYFEYFAWNRRDA